MDSPFRDDMLTITARSAAHNGHIDVVDLLAREFHAHIGVECLVDAAQYGQDVMIDHLVEKYGVDPLPSIGASLFDPEQPVDALCEQVVFLPCPFRGSEVRPHPYRQAPGREAQCRHSRQEY